MILKKEILNSLPIGRFHQRKKLEPPCMDNRKYSTFTKYYSKNKFNLNTATGPKRQIEKTIHQS